MRIPRDLSTAGVCALAWCLLVAGAAWAFATWWWRPPVAPGDAAGLERYLVETLTRAERDAR